MNRSALFLGTTLAALAVGLGAFGAHALEGKISADALGTWETGVTYHFYHALALLILSMMAKRLSSASMGLLAWLFGLGILFFSGSLYLLSTREITGIEGAFLGPITPIGGVFFILAWIGWAWSALRPAR